MPETLRALWLIKGLGTGGAERLLVNLGRARGPTLQVDVASVWTKPDRLRPELLAAGIPVHTFGVRSAADLRWLVRLRRLTARGGFDVVHAHGAAVATCCRLVCQTLPRSRRPRLVVTEHNEWSLLRPAARLLSRLTYRLDSARIAVSQPALESLPVAMRRRTSVLVHGVVAGDVVAARSDRDWTRRELGAEDDDVLVLTIANVRAEKDYGTLLTAAAAASARCRRLRFAAVGGGTDEQEDDLRRQIARAGLQGRFEYLGVRTDAVRFLAAADVFVLSSRTEGLPVALMEALCAGLPVVATAVGGVPHAVRDGREGLLVPAGRPDLLSDALVTVARDDALRTRLSAAARDRAALFDARTTSAAVEQVYRTVLQGR